MGSVLKIKGEDGNYIDIPAIKGSDGKSAYEQAVDGGFKGSEEDFIKILNENLSDFDGGHIADKDNPHNVTAEQVGALPVTGGTITGYLGINNGYGRVGADPNHAHLISLSKEGDNSNCRTILVLNDKYAPNLADAVQLRNVIDDAQKDYKLYGEHNKPTAEEVGALPKTGGLITDHLHYKNDYCGLAGDGNYIGFNAGDSGNNLRAFHVRRPSLVPNKEDAFMFYDVFNGVNTPYRIFGEHNKPTGTYQGDGNSTKEVAVGGIGDLLMVFDTADPNQTMYLVSSQGKVWYSTGSAGGINSHNTKAKYVDGKLILSNQDTTYPQLNRNGITYKYQVL